MIELHYAYSGCAAVTAFCAQDHGDMAHKILYS